MDDMTEAMQGETDKERLRSEIADLKRDLAGDYQNPLPSAVSNSSIIYRMTTSSTFDEIKERGAWMLWVIGLKKLPIPQHKIRVLR